MAKKKKRDADGIKSQEPPIQTLEEMNADLAAMQTRRDTKAKEEEEEAQHEHAEAEKRKHQERCYWPKDKPLPKKHRRATRQPCRKCRRVFMDNGGQAVVHTQSGKEISYFRCKCCGEKFSVPVEED